MLVYKCGVVGGMKIGYDYVQMWSGRRNEDCLIMIVYKCEVVGGMNKDCLVMLVYKCGVVGGMKTGFDCVQMWSGRRNEACLVMIVYKCGVVGGMKIDILVIILYKCGVVGRMNVGILVLIVQKCGVCKQKLMHMPPFHPNTPENLIPPEAEGTSMIVNKIGGEPHMDPVKETTASEDSDSLEEITGRTPLYGSDDCRKLADDIINCYDSRVFFVFGHEDIPPLSRGDFDSARGSASCHHALQSPKKVESFTQTDNKHFKKLKLFDPDEYLNYKSEEKRVCKFEMFRKELMYDRMWSEPELSNQCMCSRLNGTSRDFLVGWENIQDIRKIKSSKKAKKQNTGKTQSEAFQRLTNGEKSGYYIFEHFENTTDYIEDYRKNYVVGCNIPKEAIGTETHTALREKPDPYFSKLRSTLCSVAENCDILAILSGEKDAGLWAGHVKNESKKTEDSWDDEYRVLTMRDRGKRINLAPVRENSSSSGFPVHDNRNTKRNYLTLDQYLNLMTPPKVSPLDTDDSKERRFRIANTGENNLFPACTPRRGARPLRLGSAEFVKPATPPDPAKKYAMLDTKQILERKMQMHRASSFHHSTVPGTLYVGSTVSRDAPSSSMIPVAPPTRARSGQSRKSHCSRGSTRSVIKDAGVDEGRSSKTNDCMLPVNIRHLGIRGTTYRLDDHLRIVYRLHRDRNSQVTITTVKN
ncbi:hypothetical protein CHS0354_004612 [Potamilus streckersoni]|uniref:Uncharacterized protein n=1 Tax=Potamilus streckersoni TaxID=2493646 RepID=A0AAE0VP23_9BIVA|nr:hypothetical protein CHS0354_004612 [Potamilus streckersoni]